jgi:hypothetical protein
VLVLVLVLVLVRVLVLARVQERVRAPQLAPVRVQLLAQPLVVLCQNRRPTRPSP